MDTGARAAKAGALDQTISKYDQEKSGVPAACASPWVFIAHNNTSNVSRLPHFVFQARKQNSGWVCLSDRL